MVNSHPIDLFHGQRSAHLSFSFSLFFYGHLSPYRSFSYGEFSPHRSFSHGQLLPHRSFSQDQLSPIALFLMVNSHPMALSYGELSRLRFFSW